MSTGRRRHRQLGMGFAGGSVKRLSKPFDAKTAAGVLMIGVVTQAPSQAAGGRRRAASKGDSSGRGPRSRGAELSAGTSHEGSGAGSASASSGSGAEAGDHASG